MLYLKYFRNFGPSGPLHIVRASIGALLGVFITAWVSHTWLGNANHDLPTLVAPMGASAMLVFMVPASPLAQPWPVVGGNVLSALVGLFCVHFLVPSLFAAALAVALAIAIMALFRCLHPPGGAMALSIVIGGPAIAKTGFAFAFLPVGLNAVILVLAGLAFNNATRHRYPHRAAPPAPSLHGTDDPPPQDRAGFTAADIDAVLARYDELLDISRDDLDTLFRRVEARAHRRLHGALRCVDIMSRDVITARPDEEVHQARDRLLTRRLSAMPVVDDQHRLIGIVGHAQLLAGNSRLVEEVVDRHPYCIAPERPIDELLPALSGGRHHDALIVDADNTLLGMITQTDLLAALWRSHVAEQVASLEGGDNADR